MKVKNFGKKLTAGVLATVMVFGTASLSASAATTTTIGGKSTTINADIPINGSGATLQVGKTYNLPTLVSSLTGISYTVSVSNDKVLKYKDNKITAVGTGDVTLTIKLKSGTEFKKTFHIVKPEVSITLSQSKLSMLVGQSKILKAIVSESKAKVTWSSSNDKVVSVDQNGNITANKSGSAVVTAKSSTGKTASCTINVNKPVAVTKVSVSKANVTVHVGDTYNVGASVSPANATDKTLKYTSSDTSVATVSAGKVTAKAAGTATITVKSSNGKTATCKVRVIKSVAVTKITLNKTAVSLNVGKTYQLRATVAPTNATDKTVKYTSSNTKVATVSNGKITAKAAGTATITVKSTNGKTVTCKVTVKK